jgi:hypothetical protein
MNTKHHLRMAHMNNVESLRDIGEIFGCLKSGASCLRQRNFASWSMRTRLEAVQSMDSGLIILYEKLHGEPFAVSESTSFERDSLYQGYKC